MAQFMKPMAVVTGASSGIGLELARQFAQNGYDLLICSSTAKISEAAYELEAEGASVKTVQADLSKTEGVEQLYQAIKNCGSPLDSICINAGVGVDGEFMKTSWEEELNMINLNVISTTLLAKRVLNDMIAQNHGKILFTGSVVSDNPAPYQAVYGATKAYVYSLAQALRQEAKDNNVTITTLQPGATDTDFFRRGHMQDTIVGKSKKDDPADVAKDGFEALMKGKDHVVAHSLMSKAQGLAGKIMPKTATAAMTGKMSEPGSARKH